MFGGKTGAVIRLSACWRLEECAGLVQDLLALLQGSSSVFRRKFGLDFVICPDPQSAALLEHVAQAFQRPVPVPGERSNELPTYPLVRPGREADVSADRQAPVPGRVIGTTGRVPPINHGFAASKGLQGPSLRQAVRSE